MSRINGNKTKENILFQAFILFTKMPYDKVTYEELEKATGLTRGALMYHFENKLHLFNEVIKNSLSSRSYILNIPIQEEDCLKNFIIDFVNTSKQAIKTMNSYGIKNINLAHFNIESQALYYYTSYDQLIKRWMATEKKVWTQVINKAIEKKEIKKDTDADKLAVLFGKLYLGHAYAAVFEENGCDPNLLMDEFFALYDFVKT